MKFHCSECSYKSYKKDHLKRHINKKNKCGLDPNIIEVPIDIRCEHCNKPYSSKSNLKRHYKNCKIIKANHEAELAEKDKRIAELEAKLETKNFSRPTIVIDNHLNKKLKNYLRQKARTNYKNSEIEMVCLHCGHDRGIQVCHIRELSSFNCCDTEDEINQLQNLIGLCPNCHYDLDKEKSPEVIKTVEIYQRIVKNLKTENNEGRSTTASL